MITDDLLLFFVAIAAILGLCLFLDIVVTVCEKINETKIKRQKQKITNLII